MKKNKGGRPTLMDKVTIAKLEEGFLLGCSDLEACFYADISKDTLYNYQKKNPEFVERKERLKSNPVFKARQSVLNHLSDDGNLAMKYLERKCKDEFSTKSETDNRLLGADGLPTNPMINVQVIASPKIEESIEE